MKLGGALFALVAGFCFLAGCSKKPAADTPPRDVDLGTLELTTGQPDRHDAGDGEVCSITVNDLGGGKLEVVVALEKNGKRVVSSRAGPVSADRPLEVSLSDLRIHFTPRLK